MEMGRCFCVRQLKLDELDPTQVALTLLIAVAKYLADIFKIGS